MSRPEPAVFERAGVTLLALHDGFVEAPLAVLPSADPAEAARLAAEGGFPLDPMRIDVNVFAFRGSLGLTLVDAGTGDARGPNLGHLPAALHRAGLAADAVDAVLMTHLHVDHAAGLCDNETAVFANATLVVGAAEAAFWRSDRPAGRQATQTVFARRALAAYAGRLRLVEAGDTVADGLVAVDLAGHTPGMMGYRLVGAGGSLLFCGDIANVPRVQIPCPRWGHVFDADGDAACATRLAVLGTLARTGEQIAGAHFPFPGVGNIGAAGRGFRFHPAPAGGTAGA